MPHYNLDAVRTAAKNGQVEYEGRGVRRDIENLGYELADIVRCLISLTSSEFNRTHTYDGVEYDAYNTNFAPSNNSESDLIYIKFALMDDCLLVNVASFHLSR